LSTLEHPGLDTQIYRSVLDASIKALGNASNAEEIRRAEERIARSTQRHIRARDELLMRREDEFDSTVDILTEAMVKFKDTDASFAEQVLDRSDRMKKLIAVEDVRTLRGQMFKELSELREATVAKQQTVARQLAALSTKVSTLEAKLNVAVVQANRDLLTGLKNATAWDQRLAEVDVQFQAGDESLAIALIDIDRFEALNNRLGHAAADSVLAELGELCRQAFGDDDFVARIGGDLVGALIAADGPEHAREHIFRLTNAIQRGNESQVPNMPPPFTVSIGLIMAAPGEKAAVQVEHAREALRRAKNNGRNRIVYATVRESGPDGASLQFSA
jgi:diguanylate cyclase (GGDEF)-like protein